MPTLNPTELLLLVSFSTMILLAVSLMVVLLRRLVTRMEDATAAYEILREHPELLHEQPWAGWTGSVGLAPEHTAHAASLAGRA